MPRANKILGQVSPSANTDTNLYTVPSGAQAVCSTLQICNTTSAAITYRVAVRPGGEAIGTKNYQVYDLSIAANDALPLTIGMTLAAGDVVTVRAGATGMAFTLYGAELT